ncbi:MAG TPA: type II toxin-antitoxin system Phd/YefM family antitoxin [Peptococcaceae bacterium]|nr:type II toxin-antitoxin system Phd/YefM family antitoxin [Peptococcaceae bacterium]
MDLRNVFDSMISVSELGRGQASKVIQAVEDHGNPYIVVKNNKPQAVIISVKEYTELLKAKDFVESLQSAPNPLYNDLNPADAQLYAPANRFRQQNMRPNKTAILTEDEINIFLENEGND